MHQYCTNNFLSEFVCSENLKYFYQSGVMNAYPTFIIFIPKFQSIIWQFVPEKVSNLEIFFENGNFHSFCSLKVNLSNTYELNEIFSDLKYIIRSVYSKPISRHQYSMCCQYTSCVKHLVTNHHLYNDFLKRLWKAYSLAIGKSIWCCV